MSIEAVTAFAADYISTFAMTKIFTPSSDCATFWTYEPEQANEVKGGLILQNAVSFEPTCFPPTFSQTGRMEASTVYSPGWCPVGYTSADVAVDGDITTAICCYSDFEYYTSTKKYGDTGEDIYAGCISKYPSTTSTIIPVRQETTKTRVLGPVTMWAQPITVALEADDSSLFVTPTTSSTPTIASQTSTTTTETETEQTTSASQTDQDTATEPSSTAEEEETSGSGLSTPAAIGLGVGVGIGGLAAFAAVGLWFWRSRKAKKQAATTENTSGYDRHQATYYHDTAPELPPWPVTAPASEVDGTTAKGRNARYELYG